HLAAPRPELFDHRAEEFLRDVDRQLFVRLETLTARTLARDHTRPRDLELVSLAPHGLHQDREMQLTASGNGPGIGRLRILDTQRDVSLELAIQPVTNLSRRHKLSIAAGKRRVVDEEVHGD